ncbi:hypothetical protein FRC06_005438 [Ceratobasidium sp. 370]|nr:hypothetical protein FRC06_005438 [Ceratobasidium sp. 370]
MSHHSVSEVESVESDRNASLAANIIAQNTTLFTTWAEAAKLLPPDGRPLPDVLQELIATSKVVPSWIYEPQASQYDHGRRMFTPQIEVLAASEDESFTTSGDQGLSEDVECSLVPIFEVIKHTERLQQQLDIRPKDADRRVSVDHLVSHLWNYSGGGDLMHRTECAVQLPVVDHPVVAEARPDSAVFFQLNSSNLFGISKQASQACSSFVPRSSGSWKYVLHWVIEYKGGRHTEPSKRQAWMGMASGLYQRRSLGFKDHFVFGAAHHSDTSLAVFAGGWLDDTAPPAAASTSRPEEKIAIYTLGTFDMASTSDILQYYLLMRDTRRLALQYKAAIDAQARKLVTDISRSQPRIHFWPTWGSGPKSSVGSDKKRKLDSVLEESGAAGENRAPKTSAITTVGTNNFDDRPVHVVGVDDPFIHLFAEELSENGERAKVRDYTGVQK